MKLIYLKYLPIIALLIFGYLFFKIKFEKGYFAWVKKFWFLKRTKINKVSSLLNILGIVLLLISLLDIRGPEEKIDANIPDQKTIIIIDSSSSMLVEDIRPNRFHKAILMARHFIKNSHGHQIAVVLFSDVQKRIIPFTDDIDLLDSRISGLGSLNILNGGSNITQAIQESVQYFKMGTGLLDEVKGNILVFTDAEGHEEKFNLTIPKKVNLAMVGIGTAKGGPIPIRGKNGTFRGYKRFKGINVISKLNDSFLKKFENLVDNYKYWVISSYSIPTEEILRFFRSIHESRLSKGQITIRPVLTQWVVIPAILLLVLSTLLRFRKTFLPAMIVLFVFGLNGQVEAQTPKGKELDPKAQKKQLEVLKKLNDNLEDLKSGKMSPKNKLKLAETLLKMDQTNEALTLYQENTNSGGGKNFEAQFNKGTAFLKSGDVSKGVTIYEKLREDLKREENPSLDKYIGSMRNNILLAVNQKQQQKQKQKNQEKKQKKDQKDQQKQQKDQQQQQKESQQKDQKQQQSSQEKEKEKEEKKKQKGQKKEEEKEKKKNEKKEKDKEKQKKEESKKEKEKEKGKKKKPKSVKEREENIKKMKKMVKIPAMIKQIMGEDRKLQERYIDTSTKKRTNNRQKKDW